MYVAAAETWSLNLAQPGFGASENRKLLLIFSFPRVI
jgi:hypothetical protein